MPVVKRNISYFDRAGFLNTNSVLEAVKERLRLGDVKTVVVPVTTGRTADIFSQELKGEAEVVTVSEEETVSACKRIIPSDQDLLGKLVRSRLKKTPEGTSIRLRRDAFDMTLLPFCREPWNAVRETLYSFGQGMKVAIEISVAAVEMEKVQPHTKVIAVGGTGEGADTAIVVRASNQKEAFGKKPEKRLSIQEILTMPIEKS